MTMSWEVGRIDIHAREEAETQPTFAAQVNP